MDRVLIQCSQEVSIDDFCEGMIDYHGYATYVARTAMLHADYNSVHERATKTWDKELVLRTEDAFYKYLKAIRY